MKPKIGCQLPQEVSNVEKRFTTLRPASRGNHGMILSTTTTLCRFVNARRQHALNHTVAENPGRRGRSSAAAKSTLFSSEGAELAVFLPKTRFRVGGVANGISDFLVKKPISVFDRIEELDQAACKLMFTSFPVHSEAIQQLLQPGFSNIRTPARAGMCTVAGLERAWMLW